MCGILGFSGKGDIKKIVRDGLKSLEYRGYDSSGYALLQKNSLEIKKKVGKGKIEELVEEIPEYSQERVFVIAHTRWATHGRVNLSNAHPHTDCRGEIAVVHNGIISNYTGLKKQLENKGHRFVSETDTEVIAHLIEENTNKFPFDKAVMKSFQQLDGSFALLVIKKGENKIIGARNGSPLVVGKDSDVFFVSSDINSITKYTDTVMFLEDGEMFVLDETLKFFDYFGGKSKEKKYVNVEMFYHSAISEGYETYMEKEIMEQPEVIERTWLSLYERLSDYIKEVEIPERIIIVACGSSWHAGLIGEYFLEDIVRIPVEVEYASEFRYRNPVILDNDIVVAISQSGETADTLGAIKDVRNKARVLSICNVYNSSLTRESDYVLYTSAGPEVGVAATKTFTAQLVALYFLTLLLACKRKVMDISAFKKKTEEINGIIEKVIKVLEIADRIEILGDKLKDRTNALFLGRGMQFPVALEGALKMKEVSYIHAEGYPAAEMKHGPIALIDEDMPVVFSLVKDRFYTKILHNMEEVKARGGYIITVTDFINEEIKKISDEIIHIPLVKDEYLKPVLTVIPLQLLAYFTARKRGCDVDKPRNLAKSVTVE
ncbi:MAG TPA: glutamine--fructose-6-phosphate transaminase (isomerizing) [bacterium]|nr:glutamine--fructose-6-phosphate transaminase (isomerizing) [bacterium]HPP29763.1 glutamine--fructose-6-phosphate transaminase (isomerizing) [bacterium]